MIGIRAPRALFVADLDGTLLDEAGELSLRNREAIARATEAGVCFAIATGRRRSTFRRERERFAGLTLRVSCSNGTVLLGEDNESVESVRSIPWSGLVALAASRPPEARAFIGVLAPSERNGRPVEPDAVVLDGDGRYHLAASPWDRSTWVETGADEVLARPLVHAAVTTATRADAETMVAALLRAYPGEVEAHTARAPRMEGVLAEAVAPGGKGSVVRDLARSLGIAEGATGAIGDEYNDEALLGAAHHRYTVGGSALAERLRGRATEVGGPERGVADALERLLAVIG